MATYARCAISSGTLNVRNNPSTSALIVYSLVQNEVVEVLSTYPSANFYPVQRGGQMGWASADYLSILNNQGYIGTGMISVSGNLNVRSGPSTAYAILGSLWNGASVHIYMSQGGWYLVLEANSLAGGWVQGNYVINTGNTPSALSISGSMAIPNPLTQGTPVSVRGFVTSNYNVTEVFAEIVGSSYRHTVFPNVPSYNMSGMDNILLFSQLLVGNYTYRVTARDAIGTMKLLVNTSFSVIAGSGGGTPPGRTVYTNYSDTLEEALAKQMRVAPQKYSGGWVNATQSEVRSFLEPNNHMNATEKYQFLDLSAPAGISESSMRSFLSNKGILAGKERLYLDAAARNGICEIYLAAHSCLETENGTSELAIGARYNNTTVYNMYGIGAYDSDPVGLGAKMAYEMGWFTPEFAISDGARWIAEQYINSSDAQNTLYKMRWNPSSPGTHQYATDINWAIAQTSSIKRMYDNFPTATLTFDIPVYRA